MTGIKSTWSGLLDQDNMFFLLKHFVAFSFCWVYAIYVDNYGGACVVTAVFLMNNLACPDVQGLLNSMNAVILAAVVGSLVFEWSCESRHSSNLHYRSGSIQVDREMPCTRCRSGCWSFC